MTIEVGPGLYLLYGHMKPDTVRVRVGQRVRRGQPIGRIGSSGNSTTPHLHFQIITTATFFPTGSVPYVFDAFTVVGKETRRIWDDNLGLQPTGTIPIARVTPPTTHRHEMPLDRDIIIFTRSH